VVVEPGPDGFRLKRAALARTARRIMDGTAYVPLSKLPSEAARPATAEPVGAA
jgi:hypothetical protein